MIDTQPLLANIKRHVSLSNQEEQEILAHTQIRRFKKGENFCSEGEINRYANYILEGRVREYFIDRDGNEHVLQLGIRDWWTGDFGSFITQQPGIINCEAMANTTLIAFSYEQLNELYEKVPAMERFYRMMIQYAYAAFKIRVIQSMSMDAEERYLKFQQTYPLVEQEFPQKDVASYLGMSAEFLSKIKKRIRSKNKVSKSSYH